MTDIHKADDTKFVKPFVQLTGQDGNAFAILGECRRAARTAGWPKERIDTFLTKAKSGDYDNLLCVCIDWFEVG